jgi:hypothetical protein
VEIRRLVSVCERKLGTGVGAGRLLALMARWGGGIEGKGE